MKANEHSIQSFLSFVRDRFNGYEPLKRYYQNDFDRFYRHYLNCHGFSDYIEKVVKGKTLEFSDIVYIGRLYLNEGDRKPHDIPKVLGYLEKFHNVSYDTLDPIYVAEFWDSYQDQSPSE